LQSAYVGDCDCSALGAFTGQIAYAGGLHFQAANAEGAALTGVPLRLVNQILVNFTWYGETCMYVWEVSAGSLFGMPIEEPLEYSSECELAFIGLEKEMSSAASARRAATKHNLNNNHNHKHEIITYNNTPRRSATNLSTSTWGEACPQAEEDCRFTCLSEGFRGSAFGALLALTPKYEEAECDCALVFPESLPSGQPTLYGTLVQDVEGGTYLFHSAMDLLGHAGADPQWVVDVVVQPLYGDRMRLVFETAPAVRCAYIFSIGAGGLLGVGKVFRDAPELVVLPTGPLQLAVSGAIDGTTYKDDLIPVEESPVPSLAALVQDVNTTAFVVSATVAATVGSVVVTSVVVSLSSTNPEPLQGWLMAHKF